MTLERRTKKRGILQNWLGLLEKYAKRYLPTVVKLYQSRKQGHFLQTQPFIFL